MKSLNICPWIALVFEFWISDFAFSCGRDVNNWFQSNICSDLCAGAYRFRFVNGVLPTSCVPHTVHSPDISIHIFGWWVVGALTTAQCTWHTTIAWHPICHCRNSLNCMIKMPTMQIHCWPSLSRWTSRVTAFSVRTGEHWTHYM